MLPGIADQILDIFSRDQQRCVESKDSFVCVFCDAVCKRPDFAALDARVAHAVCGLGPVAEPRGQVIENLSADCARRFCDGSRDQRYVALVNFKITPGTVDKMNVSAAPGDLSPRKVLRRPRHAQPFFSIAGFFTKANTTYPMEMSMRIIEMN